MSPTDGLVASRSRSLDRRGLTHLAVVIVVGATTFLAIRLGVGPGGGFAPLGMGQLRFLVAGGLLVALASLRRAPHDGRTTVIRALGVGAILWGAGNGLASVAATSAGAGLVALFFATAPLWVMVIDAVSQRRIPGRLEVASLGVGVVAVMLLSLPSVDGLRVDTSTWLALVGAPVAMAMGIVALRSVAGAADATLLTGLQMLGGAAALTVARLAVGEAPSAPTAQGWVALGYLVVAGSVAFRSFTIALQRLPTPVFLSHSWANPVLAAVLAAALLGEPWGRWQSAATVAVVVALWLLVRSKRSDGLRRPVERRQCAHGRRCAQS